jgi:transposase
MERWTIVLSKAARRRTREKARRCGDASMRTRYLIVAHSAEGWHRAGIARALGCSVSVVTRVRRRWVEEGEAGLIDRREDNGELKADERYGATLLTVLENSSQDWGHGRPTWTQRLLIETMTKLTGVRVSRTTMSRLLKRLKVGRKRPKPLAPCPWSARARTRRMQQIHRLIDRLRADEAAVWEDETDIDLNPRIGPDWMPPGVRREVMTPGKNVKRYLGAAMDAATQRLVWARGRRKDSGLFIDLLKKLARVYADKRVIHVILDNYSIHGSRRTRAWLAQHGGKFRLHFLPPYSPDDNRIEVCVFRHLHPAVTYNHTEPTIEDLMANVLRWLINRDRRAARRAVA